MPNRVSGRSDPASIDVERFAFEEMEVFQLALAIADLADDIAVRQQARRPWCARQLGSASLSILNNTAEGLGEYSAGDKSRFFRYALRSAFETTAMIVFLAGKSEIAPASEAEIRALLLKLAKTLTRMATHFQQRRPVRR